MIEDTYDILDAGPRNRFCVNGRIVHNCSGNGPQPTNLPNHGPDVARCGCGRYFGRSKPRCPWCGSDLIRESPVRWCAGAVEDALAVAASGSLELMEMYWDEALPILSGCLRGLFVAADGHDLICSDYSAIEAVVLAELAGESWRQEVFRDHGKIYEMSAARAFGVPFEEITKSHPIRKKGKVLELACLGPRTQVLTPRGLVPIVDMAVDDLVWDGVAWTNQGGVVERGVREVVNLDGVLITPDHLVNTNGFWMEANQLVFCEGTHYQARATGSANLPSSISSLVSRAGLKERGCFVRAGQTLIEWISTISCRGKPHGAINARKKRLVEFVLRDFGSTRQTSQMWSTVDGCSIDSPLPATGVITRKTQDSKTTAPEGYMFSPAGGRIAALFYAILQPSKGGTTLLSKWTVPTSIKAMSRVTSVSSLVRLTTKIKEKLGLCSRKSKILKNLLSHTSPVYDLINCGPRNQFTIATDSGFLIVHNCGYGGWVGALKAFGADEFMTEDEMTTAAGAWRRASPAIVEYWGGQTRRTHAGWVPELFGVEGAAISAMRRPGEWFAFRTVAFALVRGVLYCRLPSGRYLVYHEPRLTPSTRRPGEWALSYAGWNTNPKNGPVGWIRMDTYGPKLVENITQATARDILRDATLALEAAGYRLVLHVYDEIICEVPAGFGSVEEMERIMCDQPPWAAGWPIRAAGGWRGRRYRKDD